MPSSTTPLATEVLRVLQHVTDVAMAATPSPPPPRSGLAPGAGTGGEHTLSAEALTLVREHLLAPLAYGAGFDGCRHDAIANTLLWDIRHALLREVVAQLAAQGIAAAPIKGMSYALHLYRDPAWRPMSDIDILVEAPAFTAAIAVLRANGFVHTGGSHQLTATHHAMTFKRHAGVAGGGVAIDLHRHIVHASRTNLSAQAWWQGARNVGEDGWQLAPTDELLLHIAHMARHEFYVPFVNIVDGALLFQRWQADCADAGGVAASWEVLRNYAVRARMERMYSVWRYITASALGWTDGPQPSPRSLLVQAATPELSRLAVAQMPTRWRQIGQKLALSQGPREVLALAKSAAAGLTWRWRPHRA